VDVLDNQLDATIRAELATLDRCVSETEDALALPAHQFGRLPVNEEGASFSVGGVKDLEVAPLLQQAADSIKLNRNPEEARELLQKAENISPHNQMVLQMLALVLGSLHEFEGALVRYRKLFSGGVSDPSNDRFVLQQYLLTLQRLGKEDDLQQEWPRLVIAAGLKWPSILQCPDRYDASLFTGASPFPSLEGLRIPRVLASHGAALAAEFSSFAEKPGWDSSANFRSHQDNDLILGRNLSQWTEMLLFDRGSWDLRACQFFPTACGILRGLPEIEGVAHGHRAGQVGLLKMEAGTSLAQHFGTANWRYVAHFGLLVPDGVFVTSGGETRQYEQGKVLVLDDSWLHSVEHTGQGARFNLFVNFFHPHTVASELKADGDDDNEQAPPMESLYLGRVRQVVDGRTIEIRDMNASQTGTRTRKVLQLDHVPSLFRGLLSNSEYEAKSAAAKDSLEQLIRLSNLMVLWRRSGPIELQADSLLGSAIVADVWSWDGKNMSMRLLEKTAPASVDREYAETLNVGTRKEL